MDKEKFKQLVEDFQKARDAKGKPLKMHALLVKDEKVNLHYFRKEARTSDVRSLSKTILTLAFGRLMQLAHEGKYPMLDEETTIYPILKDRFHLENKANEERIEKIKIKHLLTHRIGFEKVLMMRQDIDKIESDNYLTYIFNQPILHEPGEYYLYSNAGFYLLSAFMEEFIKEDLATFLKREFFQPLGIQEFTWEKYGDYLAGATRLWLSPIDLLSIAEIFLEEGKVAGEEFISKDWLEKMTVQRVATKKLDPDMQVFKRSAYGYGTWLAAAGFYFGHGTDGQRMIILPEKEVVLITLANQADTKAMDQLIDSLVKTYQ